MSTIDDLDCGALISRLAGPLSPSDRAAFRRAAEDAIARVPCWGEDAVYRAAVTSQRQFLNPRSFGRASWGIEQGRPSKLKNAPPIAHAGDGRVVRYRGSDERLRKQGADITARVRTIPQIACVSSTRPPIKGAASIPG